MPKVVSRLLANSDYEKSEPRRGCHVTPPQKSPQKIFGQRSVPYSYHFYRDACEEVEHSILV